MSVFYSLPVFQFIPNFFQIYFQFASNSPCFQFLSHEAAISSKMNSCKKSVSFNFKKCVKKLWKRQLTIGLSVSFCLLLRWSHMLMVESEWCELIVCYGAGLPIIAILEHSGERYICLYFEAKNSFRILGRSVLVMGTPIMAMNGQSEIRTTAGGNTIEPSIQYNCGYLIEPSDWVFSTKSNQ